MMANKKIGLALGGGAARGLAHIGVLKALQNNKTAIPILDNIDKAIAKRSET